VISTGARERLGGLQAAEAATNDHDVVCAMRLPDRESLSG
jgi:hypothetical protein